MYYIVFVFLSLQFIVLIYKFKCVMRKRMYSVVIESDVSRHGKLKFQSAYSSRLSFSDDEFSDAVRLILDGKLHASHVYLLCNDYIIKEFHINLFSSKCYDKRTI